MNSQSFKSDGGRKGLNDEIMRVGHISDERCSASIAAIITDYNNSQRSIHLYESILPLHTLAYTSDN
ncbi:hypothetical protein QJS10_CPA06g00734 [Acorus calamus]|uniref:Uncharacterized protein n=1 Tax=Acorus calamus TaxID=4465 RepID=A0AAV9EK80_ACOCL|nr:hypothetical protein QJS10_CPA06g00734 [Acorus calamus]